MKKFVLLVVAAGIGLMLAIPSSRQALADIATNLGRAGAAVPSLTALVGGSDGTNLRSLKTDTSGDLYAQPPLGTASTNILGGAGSALLVTLGAAYSSCSMVVQTGCSSSCFLSVAGHNASGASFNSDQTIPITNDATGSVSSSVSASTAGAFHFGVAGLISVTVTNAGPGNSLPVSVLCAPVGSGPQAVYGTVTATVSGATLAPNPIATLETPAAASPVACTAANVAVLSANTRSTAWFQNTGSVDLCLCYHATTCPAPSASGCGANGVALKAATSAGKADGGPWIIGNNSGKTWSGGISCGGSAGGLLHAGAY